MFAPCKFQKDELVELTISLREQTGICKVITMDQGGAGLRDTWFYLIETPTGGQHIVSESCLRKHDPDDVSVSWLPPDRPADPFKGDNST